VLRTSSRKEASDKPRKMTPDLVALVEEKLTQEQRSPNQISGRLAQDGVACISHERIYQHKDSLHLIAKSGRRNGRAQRCSLRSHRLRRLKPLTLLTLTLSPAVHSAMSSVLHCCTLDLKRRPESGLDLRTTLRRVRYLDLQHRCVMLAAALVLADERGRDLDRLRARAAGIGERRLVDPAKREVWDVERDERF
jgi:hypothetical protein